MLKQSKRAGGTRNLFTTKRIREKGRWCIMYPRWTASSETRVMRTLTSVQTLSRNLMPFTQLTTINWIRNSTVSASTRLPMRATCIKGRIEAKYSKKNILRKKFAQTRLEISKEEVLWEMLNCRSMVFRSRGRRRNCWVILPRDHPITNLISRLTVYIVRLRSNSLASHKIVANITKNQYLGVSIYPTKRSRFIEFFWNIIFNI